MFSKEKLGKLRKAFLRKKYISILLALFTLGVNIFAWFAFSDTAEVELDGTVASWDVEFRDNNGVETNNFLVSVANMKPGMNNFSQSLTVYNRSDVEAKFVYEIQSFSLFGNSITNYGNDIDHFLQSTYPFEISVVPSKNNLGTNDNLSLSINVKWDYESTDPLYFKVQDFYDFDEGFTYYVLNEETYTPVDVTSTNYASLKSTLYLEKDDVDTFFGEKCGAYEDSTSKPCLELDLLLQVQQKNN